MSWQPDIPKFINFEKPAIVSGGTFSQQNHFDNRHYTFRNGENAGYATLMDNVAAAAMHDSGHVLDPPKCHPNTRVAIIQSVIDWTKGIVDEEMNQKSVFWLNGGAGAGKSAIARSVAERCFAEGLLLGSFFFAAGDATRNHVGGLVATLCYQMCRILPGFREMVSSLIANDPLIFKSSISTQLTTLLFDPFCRLILAGYPGASTTWIPRLIVIDGLDECSESTDQKNLLLALQETTRSTTLIRFLVCSRPENHINAAFSLPRMANILYKIFLGDDYDASGDIRQYLEDKFAEIKEGHIFKHTLPIAWPTQKMLYDLVDKSSGQFIYASTVVRYIESSKHRPHQRLEAIFNLREPAFKDLPFTQLDALYRHVVSKAENLPKVLDILAFPALYGNPSAESIEVILQLQEGDVEIVLADLQSIVRVGIWPMRGDIRVWFLHKSLTDFLSDRQRAGELYRDLPAARLQHIARIISIFSVGSRVQRVDLKTPFENIIHIFRAPNSVRADYVSRDILHAAQQFPMFKFIKCPMLVENGRGPQSDWPDLIFLIVYIDYLCGIKDVSEATSLVYTEQMSQYCKGVLSALEDDFSDSWMLHFFYAFWHLSPLLSPLCPYKIAHWRLEDTFGHVMRSTLSTNDSDAERLAYIIAEIIGFWEDQIYQQKYYNFRPDIHRISFQLTKGIKQKVIFAKSAAFCLAFLCDEGSTSPEARSITKIMGIDQRKRRKHPWRWRQLSPRRSLHNQLIVWRHYCCYRGNQVVVLRRLRAVKKMVDQCCGCGVELHIYTIREYLYEKWPNPYDPEGGERQGYLAVLDFLPRILSLSGRYEPLVTMCRKKCLASMSQLWPKKSRRARRAIERYLQRVDPQENI